MSTRVVDTRRGKIAGLVEGDLAVFRGIPYAKPPFGDRLWRFPEPPKSWDGVLDCTSFGPICPQPILQAGPLGGEPEAQGEDCLRLNVWAPESDEFSRKSTEATSDGVDPWWGLSLQMGSAPGNRGKGPGNSTIRRQQTPCSTGLRLPVSRSALPRRRYVATCGQWFRC